MGVTELLPGLGCRRLWRLLPARRLRPSTRVSEHGRVRRAVHVALVRRHVGATHREAVAFGADRRLDGLELRAAPELDLELPRDLRRLCLVPPERQDLVRHRAHALRQGLLAVLGVLFRRGRRHVPVRAGRLGSGLATPSAAAGLPVAGHGPRAGAEVAEMVAHRRAAERAELVLAHLVQREAAADGHARVLPPLLFREQRLDHGAQVLADLVALRLELSRRQDRAGVALLVGLGLVHALEVVVVLRRVVVVGRVVVDALGARRGVGRRGAGLLVELALPLLRGVEHDGLDVLVHLRRLADVFVQARIAVVDRHGHQSGPADASFARQLVGGAADHHGDRRVRV